MTAPLVRETRAAKALKAAYPEVAGDDDAVRDLIEGETRLHEILGYVLRSIMDDQTMSAAIAERSKDLQGRKQRIDARIQRKREMCEQAMQEAELKRYEGPECTATLSERKPSLTVYAADELPETFLIMEPKADKTAIRSALEKGEAVPGATLTNAAPSLTLRTR